MITDMNQPCCGSLGSALEIMEVMTALTSRHAESPLCDLTCALGADLLVFGGPLDFVSKWRDRLPSAPVVRDVYAPRRGFIYAMNGQALGMTVVHLGGGRLTGDERIDPVVGLSNMCQLGGPVDEDIVITTIHARTPEMSDAAQAQVLSAIDVADAPSETLPLIYEKVSA